ncbi:hypothetical protein [Bifidobacterium cuniculi]|uniref:Uncharacterized protein n=1 Tax=Bifidobacterium cuniculi TaxID=1688 RepID=A0A087B502_9BIFI|nr:hypothetical protein [Bifidobacterium cuniculi]KFI66102.1 hypothetical protein BCUN_0604 [Bifidobacterium cuniculi]
MPSKKQIARIHQLAHMGYGEGDIAALTHIHRGDVHSVLLNPEHPVFNQQDYRPDSIEPSFDNM